MGKQNKVKVNNFKLSLSDADKDENLWSGTFSRIQVLVAAITVAVVFIVMIFSLIAFTPVKVFIPGYPDARTRKQAIDNAIRIDSLEAEILKWEFYSENLARVVEGREPLPLDSLYKTQATADTTEVDMDKIAESEKTLRENVAKEDEFNLKPMAGRTALPIEGLHFFIPLKGVISQGFDKNLHPYVDISAPENSVVYSVLDGTIISAGWSDNYGYSIQVQHEGDIVSVYKHNQRLLKKTGDKVTAGMPIAIVGNTGQKDKGNHLRFELWHKGEAIDPTKYISF